ncbi:helix-turn-helix domain-containing protein [Fusobacterium gastrosuis]|uniref:helix-turn-helix domain-containing protein n=1 Tax=Fusobacterium gastrosuis TaxID=1755100 RepID=UPI002A9EC75B|nr:helix-turn-helix transcriptional regulator [Fusobacterium gastrosuis]
MDMYDRIRNRRKELKMTQDELAKLTGYNDRSSIAKIEAKKADLSQSKIIAFAKALKVTTSYLMDGEEEKPQPQSNFDKIKSQLTPEELIQLEKFNNMSTVMFMNEGNNISDEDKETLAIAYAEVLISQRKK